MSEEWELRYCYICGEGTQHYRKPHMDSWVCADHDEWEEAEGGGND